MTTEDGKQMPEPGLRAQLMRLRYDLTAAQAKLTDAIAMFDALGIEDDVRRASFINGPVLVAVCPCCGVAAGHASDCEAA